MALFIFMYIVQILIRNRINIKTYLQLPVFYIFTADENRYLKELGKLCNILENVYLKGFSARQQFKKFCFIVANSCEYV